MSRNEPLTVVPEELRRDLSMSLIHMDADEFYRTVEDHRVDVDALLHPEESETILLAAVCSPLSEWLGSEAQLGIVRFLLDRRVRVDHLSNSGYTALHVAISDHRLVEIALMLIRADVADVNLCDKKAGQSPVAMAVREYRLTWRPEQAALREFRYQIIEELLARGADLDKDESSHGDGARGWLKLTDDTRLDELLDRMGLSR